MRRSFRRITTLFSILALATAVIALTGCQTSQPEPVFEDYQIEVSSPSSQPTTEPAANATEQAEPSPVAAAADSRTDGMSDVFQVGDSVNVLVTGVSSEMIPPHEEGIKDDGTISLYLIGTVQAAGRSPGELQRELQKRYEVYFKNPVVTVQSAQRFYYVGGEVKRPGAQPYLGKTTVTKAIQSAGDFTDFAKKTKIQVIRADGTSLRVNFNKAINEPRLDPPIYPGDKLHVPRRILW